MDRDSYIDPVVEAYMPTATVDQKLAVMAELWAYFDMLLERVDAQARFDSITDHMVESDSHRTSDAPSL